MLTRTLVVNVEAWARHAIQQRQQTRKNVNPAAQLIVCCVDHYTELSMFAYSGYTSGNDRYLYSPA